MIDLVRRMIDEHGRLRAPARDVSIDADLYELGLTPFTAVQVMLALEEAAGVQFPDEMLRRRNFASIGAMLACLERLDRRAAA